MENFESTRSARTMILLGPKPPPTASQGKKSRELSEDEREHMLQLLLLHSEKGVLGRSILREVSSLFHVHPTTGWRLWVSACQYAHNNPNQKVLSLSRKNLTGARKKFFLTREDILAIPLHLRKTQRSIAKRLKVSQTTVTRFIRNDELRRVRSTLKPTLTLRNKEARVAFVADHFGNDGRYVDMMDRVHVDEKWFYLTKIVSNLAVLHESNFAG